MDKKASNNLEKRLANTEMALATLLDLINDSLSATCSDRAVKMMNEYFRANEELGADFGIVWETPDE